MIFVGSNYGYNQCTDPSTYKCEDGYKPTREQIVKSLGDRCADENCDELIQDDSSYCEAAEEYCSSTLFVRNSPVYSFNGTTGVRYCDSKERINTSVLAQMSNVKTSCADGTKIYSVKLQKFCRKVVSSHVDEKLRPEEFKRCYFVKRGDTAEEFKSRGDAFCEYVFLYCNSERT
uniref:Uncharacterized protein n=1 Tax=Tetranychus urticae TaxID=32264 RepID=T1KCY6_TETUR